MCELNPDIYQGTDPELDFLSEYVMAFPSQHASCTCIHCSMNRATESDPCSTMVSTVYSDWLSRISG